jgi:hypothetical protein
MAGWITSFIHVDAKTSVHAMCGVAGAVNSMGEKCSMKWVMRRMHRCESSGESTYLWAMEGKSVVGK